MQPKHFKFASLILSLAALAAPQALAKPGVQSNRTVAAQARSNQPSDAEILKQLGGENNPAAINMLARIYAFEGTGSTDLAKAKALFERSAQAGDAEGQTSLGMIYYKGSGVPQNYQQAKFWFEKAAAQGNVTSQSMLGMFYLNGHGVKQDYAQARSWFEKAAAQGDVSSMRMLGNIYVEGLGVPKNLQQARAWYEKAAIQDDTDVQSIAIMEEIERIKRSAH